MTKRKIPERARDCVTLADKIGFSLMVSAKFEALRGDPWAGPEQFSELMEYYDPDGAFPWSHPEWASDWARAERSRREVLRALGDEE